MQKGTLINTFRLMRLINTLEQNVDILEKNVTRDFFLELVVESIKNINFEILDPW
jgi:hypothetical protein